MTESSYHYTGYIAADGYAMPTQSSEAERQQSEMFRNIERKAAYELRQAGHMQPIVWRAK